jgi:hypothetical protein
LPCHRERWAGGGQYDDAAVDDVRVAHSDITNTTTK